MSAKTQPKYLVGVDEAGRGPLAGPVAIGVVSVASSNQRLFKKVFAGVKDCKQLSELQREKWWQRLRRARQEGLICFNSSLVGNRQIDQEGIVMAVSRGINRSLRRLPIAPRECRVLLDGSLRAPKTYLSQQTIIRGDEQEMIIALASIAAKVRRDHYMIFLAQRFPGYDFEVHKGYGTANHYRALKRLGLSPIHRRTFLSKLVNQLPE